MNTRQSTVLTYSMKNGDWLQVAINLNEGTMQSVRVVHNEDGTVKLREIDETTTLSILHTYTLTSIPSKKAKRYIQ